MSEPGSPDQPPGYAPPTYGQPQYGQPQYGQPQYGQPQYGQPLTPYGVQDHPQATTALVLGLVSVIGGLMCGVPLLAAPFAWVIGVKAGREIREANGQLGGEGSAKAGMVLGIIGSVLLALALIGLVILTVVLVNDVAAINDYGVV